MSGEYVTQEQFRQTLELLEDLRDERAAAAAERHKEVIGRIDALTTQQTKMVEKQTEANGRTGTLEGVVRRLACVRRGTSECADDKPDALELRAGSLRWRPTRTQLAYALTALGGMVSWPALGKLGELLQWLARGAR
jgi:hypothetical protein